MAQEYAKRFYKSTAWQRCRQGFIVSKFGLCEKCKQPGSIVHHKKHITPDNINDPSVTLHWDNLMLLCTDCHNTIHGQHRPTRDDLEFDETGQVVPRRRRLSPPKKNYG